MSIGFDDWCRKTRVFTLAENFEEIKSKFNLCCSSRNDAKAAWNYQQSIINHLNSENKKMIEFIKDCSVSHHETRYKFRAQVILKELEK